MPKCSTLSSTWSIAWICMSPPGQPNGITEPSSRTAIAGLGVSRGRLPGATPAGWAGSGRDCRPRSDGTMPRPGITGAVLEASDGVAENVLPHRSTTHTYEVPLSVGSASGDGGGSGWAVPNSGSGSPDAARRRSIVAAHAAACSRDSSRSRSTSTNAGSP